MWFLHGLAWSLVGLAGLRTGSLKTGHNRLQPLLQPFETGPNEFGPVAYPISGLPRPVRSWSFPKREKNRTEPDF